MKNLFSISKPVLSTFSVNLAQMNLTVTEQNHNMSRGQQNAFIITLPQSKASELKKEWISYLKDNGKAKIEENNDETSFILSENRLSANPLNHYALIDESVDGPKLVAFFAFNDLFVTSDNNPVVASSIKKFMTDFAKEVYVRTVDNELNAEQKKLKSLKDDLSDFEKDENECHQNIQEYRTKIDKINYDIAINKTEQEEKQKEVDIQQQKMTDVNLNEDEKKFQNKQVANLQNDKKKLMKKEGNMRSDIENLNNKINVEQNKIPGLQAKQVTQKEAIQKQQEVVDKAAAKLNDIKKM